MSSLKLEFSWSCLPLEERNIPPLRLITKSKVGSNLPRGVLEDAATSPIVSLSPH
jgi:hypothetical protein